MSDEEKFSAEQQGNSREALEKAAMQDQQMQDVHAQLMREKEEPTEGFSPVPILLMFMFAALCFWGGIYLVHYSGGFQWNAYSPDYVAGADAPKPVEISLFDRGAKVYRNQCAQCHQADGNGVPGVYPPLAGAEWVTGHPQVVSRILINGLNGPIVVKGSTYNGNMPAFGPSGLGLSDKDIAGVITYIRQEWGNAASEVSVETIEEYSALYAGRSTPWQAAELKEGLGPLPEVAPTVEEPSVEGEEAEAPEASTETASI
jgi:mono/diheme cytochrome c family protein